MNKVFLTCFFLAALSISFAQKETFDLVSYTPPKDWTKEVNDNITSFTILNKNNNTWCRIGIIKSTTSKGSIDQDFESEWQELVVKNYNPAEAPQLNEVQEADGWKIKAGGAKFIFNNSDAMALLTTATGYNRCLSIVATANSQDYIKDIEALLASVDLIKPEINTVEIPAVNDDKNSIIGTWAMGASDQSDYEVKNGINGYIKRQYTFNTNGTYSFFIKTFSYLSNKLLLTKENGTYQISGNTITITPQKAVIEVWSKKDDVDKWGKLLSSQKRNIEITTYQFTKHYFSGIQLWNLVLQADKVTERDGPFSSNSTFNNAWYYAPISVNNIAIELPGGQQIAVEEIKKEPLQNTATNLSSTILGTWGVSSTIASSYNMNINEGSIITQYTFNANGTYGFYIKTFRYQLDKLLLTRETGTYQVSGNNLIINPQKSVIEAWSKKDGTDNWGKLLSSDKKELEKVTYSFSTENFGLGIVLILKAGNTTKRDGYFNNSSKDAWYYPAKSNLELIKLPD